MKAQAEAGGEFDDGDEEDGYEAGEEGEMEMDEEEGEGEIYEEDEEEEEQWVEDGEEDGEGGKKIIFDDAGTQFLKPWNCRSKRCRNKATA